MEINSNNDPKKFVNMFLISSISGGLAGTFVDVLLFPLDTLKTRVQSPQGFFKSGGFSKVYKGITPVIMGSAPKAALFFMTYDGIKLFSKPIVPENYFSLVLMGAASTAEVVSCLIQVPVEVCKQRRQALIQEKRIMDLKLLYRGFSITVLRDVPFSIIQFTSWEWLKNSWRNYIQRDLFPIEGAICGAIAGGLSSFLTTPLDVSKTYIILAKRSQPSSELKVMKVLNKIWMEKGIKGCFAGVWLRVTWITLGGFIYFGVYEKSKSICLTLFQ